jgi:hypothetical protein
VLVEVAEDRLVLPDLALEDLRVLRGAELDGVGQRVIADPVALGPGPLEDCAPFVPARAQGRVKPVAATADEEAGAEISLLQQVEHRGGAIRIGAVVEAERQLLHADVPRVGGPTT